MTYKVQIKMVDHEWEIIRSVIWCGMLDGYLTVKVNERYYRYFNADLIEQYSIAEEFKEPATDSKKSTSAVPIK